MWMGKECQKRHSPSLQTNILCSQAKSFILINEEEEYEMEYEVPASRHKRKWIEYLITEMLPRAREVIGDSNRCSCAAFDSPLSWPIPMILSSALTGLAAIWHWPRGTFFYGAEGTLGILLGGRENGIAASHQTNRTWMYTSFPMRGSSHQYRHSWFEGRIT